MAEKDAGRNEAKELIRLLNNFMGWSDAECADRVKIKVSDTTSDLKNRLKKALVPLWESQFNGEGYAQVPPALMLFAEEIGLLDSEAAELPAAPEKPSKKKKKVNPVVEDTPEPEPEPEDDEMEGDPLFDADDEDETPAPVKGHKVTNLSIAAKELQPLGTVELDARSSGSDIERLLLQLLHALTNEGTLVISYRSKGQESASAPQNNAVDLLRLWQQRLRKGGDLSTKKQRLAFINENEVPIPCAIKDLTEKSMAHSIMKYAKMKINGVI